MNKPVLHEFVSGKDLEIVHYPKGTPIGQLPAKVYYVATEDPGPQHFRDDKYPLDIPITNYVTTHVHYTKGLWVWQKKLPTHNEHGEIAP